MVKVRSVYCVRFSDSLVKPHDWHAIRYGCGSVRMQFGCGADTVQV